MNAENEHSKKNAITESSGAHCSAIAPDTDDYWRKRTRHAWAKYNQAMNNFMRYRGAYRGKKLRRLNKWMLEVERTLYAIPDPPETETA